MCPCVAWRSSFKKFIKLPKKPPKKLLLPASQMWEFSDVLYSLVRLDLLEGAVGDSRERQLILDHSQVLSYQHFGLVYSLHQQPFVDFYFQVVKHLCHIIFSQNCLQELQIFVCLPGKNLVNDKYLYSKRLELFFIFLSINICHKKTKSNLSVLHPLYTFCDS